MAAGGGTPLPRIFLCVLYTAWHRGFLCRWDASEKFLHFFCQNLRKMQKRARFKSLRLLNLAQSEFFKSLFHKALKNSDGILNAPKELLGQLLKQPL